jgi:hypothetical protein
MAVTFWSRILEVFDSNLYLDAVYPRIFRYVPESHQANSGIVF